MVNSWQISFCNQNFPKLMKRSQVGQLILFKIKKNLIKNLLFSNRLLNLKISCTHLQNSNSDDNQDDMRDSNHDASNQQQMIQTEPTQKRIRLKFRLNDRPKKLTKIQKESNIPKDQYKYALIANLSDKIQNLTENILKDAFSNFNCQMVKIFQDFLQQEQSDDVQTIEQEFPQSQMIKEIQIQLGTKERPIKDLREIAFLKCQEIHYYKHSDGMVLPLKVSIFEKERWVRGFMRFQDVYDAMFKRIYNYHITQDFSRRLYSMIQDVAISSTYESPIIENCWIIRNCHFQSTVKSTHNVLNNIEMVFHYLLNGFQPTGQDWDIDNKKDQAFYIKGTYESMNLLNTYNHQSGQYVELKKGSEIKVRIGGVTQETQMYVDYAFNQSNVEYRLGVLTAPKEQLCTRCFWFRLK